MNAISRKLPIGVQSFEDLRANNYLYVDKTALAWCIANSGKHYFLSRPRRFGKSLLISTFKAYFEGRKELFEGLDVEKLETEWTEYPVLHIDLSKEEYNDAEQLHIKLNSYLRQWEKRYGRGDEETLASRFSEVIRRACEQTGKKVVVLVDEYDKPLLEVMHNEKLRTKYLSTLRGFYSVLKGDDENLRFVFLTGITKFAQVSIFSDLNQLLDISMMSEYASICGVTKEELIRIFTPELNNLAKNYDMTFEQTVEKMARTYDGYHFCEDTPGLFNPFSILNVFRTNKFKYHWFQTATPSYLVELLKRSNFDLRSLMDSVKRIKSSTFNTYRADLSDPIPVFYQSGYLTIKEYNKERDRYTLDFPNDEVRYGFLNFLLPYYAGIKEVETESLIDRFLDALKAGKVDTFVEYLKAFYAGVPYDLNDQSERHYQLIFYLIFTLLGQSVETEVRSARGRADAVVKTKSYIYIIEFKLNGTAEEALRQINKQGYGEQYTTDGRKVIKLGVGFDQKLRNVDKVLWE